MTWTYASALNASTKNICKRYNLSLLCIICYAIWCWVSWRHQALPLYVVEVKCIGKVKTLVQLGCVSSLHLKWEFHFLCSNEWFIQNTIVVVLWLLILWSMVGLVSDCLEMLNCLIQIRCYFIRCSTFIGWMSVLLSDPHYDRSSVVLDIS